jgi:hypothetical protein
LYLEKEVIVESVLSLLEDDDANSSFHVIMMLNNDIFDVVAHYILEYMNTVLQLHFAPEATEMGESKRRQNASERNSIDDVVFNMLVALDHRVTQFHSLYNELGCRLPKLMALICEVRYTIKHKNNQQHDSVSVSF